MQPFYRFIVIAVSLLVLGCALAWVLPAHELQRVLELLLPQVVPVREMRWVFASIACVIPIVGLIFIRPILDQQMEFNGTPHVRPGRALAVMTFYAFAVLFITLWAERRSNHPIAWIAALTASIPILAATMGAFMNNDSAGARSEETLR